MAASGSPFSHLVALPTEVRLRIFEYLIHGTNLYYVYVSDDAKQTRYSSWRRKSSAIHRRHAMLLVNRQLSAEYLQRFYALSRFFFHADKRMRADRTFAAQWSLPESLLANVRNVKVYLEVFGWEAGRKLVDRALELAESAPMLRDLHFVVVSWGVEGAVGRTAAALCLERLKGRLSQLRRLKLAFGSFDIHQKKEKGEWVDVGALVDFRGQYIGTKV